jgi:hypothetical protein
VTRRAQRRGFQMRLPNSSTSGLSINPNLMIFVPLEIKNHLQRIYGKTIGAIVIATTITDNLEGKSHR